MVIGIAFFRAQLTNASDSCLPFASRSARRVESSNCPDAVGVPEDDRAFARRLARYCARNPVALERLPDDATLKQGT